MQKEVIILFNLIFILQNIYAQDSLDRFRQEKLYQYLLDVRKPDIGSGSLNKFHKEDYYIPKNQKRFLELLTKEWNEEEKEIWRNYYAERYKVSIAIETENILKKDTSKIYEEVF